MTLHGKMPMPDSHWYELHINVCNFGNRFLSIEVSLYKTDYISQTVIGKHLGIIRINRFRRYRCESGIAIFAGGPLETTLTVPINSKISGNTLIPKSQSEIF